MKKFKKFQKPFKNKVKQDDPTPEQIASTTAKIRNEWDERVRLSRWVGGRGFVYPELKKEVESQ